MLRDTGAVSQREKLNRVVVVRWRIMRAVLSF
jgi:hypothetical protein